MQRTAGFWVIMIISFLFVIGLIMGQTMSFINYEFTVSLGLQEPESMITKIGVALNKGFGVADTIIYLPLMLLGMLGLWQNKRWGIYMMSCAMAVTAYWPIMTIALLWFAKGSPGFNFTAYTSYTILLSLISIYGIWGMWYLYKKGIE